ncbi:MAG: hypothetical protein R2794_03675 [Chitinophagales bacterium]
MQVLFNGILPGTDEFIFTVGDNSLNEDWVVIKSIIFPMINLVWLGVIIMALGFGMSMIHRLRSGKSAE